MELKRLHLPIDLISELMQHPILHEGDVNEHLNLLVMWGIRELDQRYAKLIEQFESDDLEWFKGHVNFVDLLIYTEVSDILKTLHHRWADSSFEEEVNLPRLLDSVASLEKQDMLALCWGLSKK